MPRAAGIQDAQERELALDPGRSFLVQAPAGSGKTELLIQRYLVLLARVGQPESVVAITFTRKAAGEMHRRVLDALEQAVGPQPEEPHKRKTWELARAVRERSSALGWGLDTNPNRLRIRTIDSLSASITRRMPWLARLGAQPEMVEDARELYREAARNTIALVDHPDYAAAIGKVLLHLDNDFGAFEQLLAGMLARRDQWLRHIAGVDPGEARSVLEESLCSVIEDALADLRDAVPAAAEHELAELAAFAARCVAPGHAITACAGLDGLPGACSEELPAWLGIAAILLTGGGEWRSVPRGITRAIGFPPDCAEKARLCDLISSLESCTAFRTRLHALRRLPPAVFEDDQWEVVASLIPVLMAAYGELRLVFRARGQTDFSEIALAALTALGTDAEPTDLALALDYEIRHLLVDEFQDTSITQYDLLKKLTAGWEPGDGRTLFAVGDPMQSIYRFREAEVGLFLNAVREGIGSVRLEPLRLSTNFRSKQGIVEWVNGAFPRVLAPADDIATGAVRFSPSLAVHDGGENAVTVHPFFEQDDEAEAARVLEIVREARAAGERAKIAVLVRARTHLPSLLRALRRAGMRYRAVEIDQLGDVAIIQDLLALTRALLHPADRVAWLAVLRAPWCGLTLADLHALAAGAPYTAIWDLLRDPAREEALSAGGRSRLRRLRAVIATTLASPGTRLRPWVEGCWIALGGPACATNPGDLENALSFFDLLDEVDEGSDADLELLVRETERLFAGPDPQADDSLQVMTIHKAKGLEFDVVIVPGLGRKPQPDSPRLLAWLERPAARGGSDLLLAPIKQAGAKRDPLYDYVKWVEQQKTSNEDARLLYVAATRAKSQLHLLGQVELKEKDGTISMAQPSQSLLAQLWPAVEPEFARAFQEHIPRLEAEAAAQPAAIEIPQAPIRRLRAEWALPDPPAGAAGPSEIAASAAASDSSPVTFEWVGDTLRHIGTVVHRALQEIAREGAASWSRERIEAARPVWEAALGALGTPRAELAAAVATVERALIATIGDARGRWILDSAHSEASSEYAVNGMVDGRPMAARVDRTFVDAEGVRWIIDFKTSAHQGGDSAGFLDNERERYREQMTAYAGLFAKLDTRPVRVALYFPLLGGWREYDTTAAVRE